MDVIDDIDIVEPVDIGEAFSDITPKGEYSRAALLLALGILLNPPGFDIRRDLIETAPFALPELQPIPSRIDVSDSPIEEFFINYKNLDEKMINDLAWELFGAIYIPHSVEEQLLSALRIIQLFMQHPDELLRVCAAISWMDVVINASESLDILYAAARSDNELIRDIADTALARVMTGVEARSHIISSSPKQHKLVSSRESFLVHGTIFSHAGHSYEKWWKPGTGDLHNYLKNGSRPNIYSGSNYFKWSGGWNDYARSEGAAKLISWIDRNNMEGADAFAHSHGCNVTMYATLLKKMGTLVLMSCPVHWNIYRPDFTNVKNIVSIRIKWDFVIMADRGGQRFHDPKIKEVILPLWFTRHDAPRQSRTWKSRNLDSLI